jgi:endonuclease/exonuclease/phosphatase family metal-dependent hydrolase
MIGRSVARLLLAFGLIGCGGTGSPTSGEPDPIDDTVVIPPRGTDTTFDVATWNIQFFGSPSGGPADDARQLRRVRDIVRGADFDLWGVQEISDAHDFEMLLAELPGYAGLLANDASVANGPAYYSGFDDTELKVGILYKPSVVNVLQARVVLTDLDFEFAGRPPLQLRIRVTVDGETRDATVLVLHAKAGADGASWERRRDAAIGLKAYLEDRWPGDPVLVVGDWNDVVDGSIVQGRESPYRVFGAEGRVWTFVTAPLSTAGETSILGFTSVIDHILASNESAVWLATDSPEVFRVDDLISGYANVVSDHLPVLARFEFSD